MQACKSWFKWDCTLDRGVSAIVLMIPAVSQTLAQVLARQTSLESLEQIGFNRPQVAAIGPLGLDLYAYEVREIEYPPHCEKSKTAPDWSLDRVSGPSSRSDTPSAIAISFVVVPRARTQLGAQQLLSEALSYFSGRTEIPEDRLVPKLQGWGALPVSTMPPDDPVALWRALGSPLQPALYLTVMLPSLRSALPADPPGLATSRLGSSTSCGTLTKP